jgi:heme exporter protein D
MLDFDAGKYALFVWPAYALTAVMFIGLVVDSLVRARRWRRAARDREQDAGR